MPTTRPRHSVTETDSIAAALDGAALVWPALRGDRAALLRKLIEAGHTATAKSRSTIREAAGAASGAYSRDATSELKAEWPE